MKKSISEIVSDYYVVFHTDVNNVVKNSNNPVDELIFLAKKYVHKQDVDEITNRELQRFFSLHIDGLFRRKFYWKEINDEINEYESLLEGQYAALHSRTLGYASVSGMFMLLMQPNFLVATASAIIAGAATYISGREEIKKNAAFRQYIVGTRDYHQRLLLQLHNNILAEKNDDKQQILYTSEK